MCRFNQSSALVIKHLVEICLLVIEASLNSLVVGMYRHILAYQTKGISRNQMCTWFDFYNYHMMSLIVNIETPCGYVESMYKEL